MRRPPTAPTMLELLTKHIHNDTPDNDLFLRINRDFNTPAPEGRYRHWHKLQHLNPPNGLTHETWWMAIKLARSATLRTWPLQDTKGQTFNFTMPEILLKMVHRIDRRASGSIEGGDFLPGETDKRAFLMRSLQEEAITSSQLEGAATTRKIAKELLRLEKTPKDTSQQMILNNYRGMQFIINNAKHRALDPEMIFELHGLLTEETLDDASAVGRFRRDSEEIAVVDNDGTVLHDPPSARELPTRLQAMCDFANDDTEEPFVHPVIRSILLHFWLAYDHPFVDGNGRTARALFYWSMARRGYWLIEFTSISRLLLRARAQYNRSFLYVESDENDATYFILHQCRTIQKAIDELHDYLENKMKAAQRSRKILRHSGAIDLGLNHRQLALIRHAVDHPGMQYSIRSHRIYHNVSYQTARTDLLQVAKLDLLIQTKVGKAFYFLAPDDLHQRLKLDGGS